MANIKSRVSDKKELLEKFREKCRRNNVSLTPQRVSIYSILTESYIHPTAEDIFNRIRETFPDISIDTVYRTLGIFSQMGIIDVVEGYGEAKRYDPDTEPHHHFRCKRCNEIVDFHETSYNKLKVPAAIKKKYSVTNIKVVIEGLCEKCKHKK
jgi:Fur family peroxide stress response transcriptional regulator